MGFCLPQQRGERAVRADVRQRLRHVPVEVALDRRDAGVPQHRLHVGEVPRLVVRARRYGVAQEVRVDRNAAPLPQPLEQEVDRVAADRAPSLLPQRDEEGVCFTRRTDLEPLADVARRDGDRDDPDLPAFPNH